MQLSRVKPLKARSGAENEVQLGLRPHDDVRCQDLRNRTKKLGQIDFKEKDLGDCVPVINSQAHEFQTVGASPRGLVLQPNL